jgi:hypothetical protein
MFVAVDRARLQLQRRQRRSTASTVAHSQEKALGPNVGTAAAATGAATGAAAQTTSADLGVQRKLAPSGKDPLAFVVHHTGPAGSPASIVEDWRKNHPGVGAQYIVDREGKIHDVRAEFVRWYVDVLQQHAI